MNFLEKEYNRQKRLYEAEVASGRKFQETESDYNSIKGIVNGLESQLQLLRLNLDQFETEMSITKFPW